MVISNYLCQPELGTYDIRNGSMASISRYRKARARKPCRANLPSQRFKACSVIQSIGIAYSKIVLPSSDSKGKSKNRTYCPTTWNDSYTWQYAAEYADQLRRDSRASALPCKECTIGANAAQQEESKSSKYEYAQFKDMIQKLNVILSMPTGFPQIPTPRKDCHIMTYPPKQEHKQYVMCPEQDCESLDYTFDQNTSMI